MFFLGNINSLTIILKGNVLKGGILRGNINRYFRIEPWKFFKTFHIKKRNGLKEIIHFMSKTELCSFFYNKYKLIFKAAFWVYNLPPNRMLNLFVENRNTTIYKN